MKIRSLSHLLAAFILAVSVSACGGGGKPEEKIVGTWVIDMDALENSEQFKAMPEEQRKMALELSKGMASSLSFEITKDKLIANGMGEKKEVPYKVKSSTGDTLVITSEEDGKPKDVTFKFNGDKVEMMDGEGPGMALKKK